MNVCFVALSFSSADKPASGVSAQVRLFAESLIADGHSVQVVTLGALDRVRTDAGIQVREVRRTNLHWYVSRLPIVGRFFALPVRELEYAIAAWKGIRHARKDQIIDLVEGTETGMMLVSLFHKTSPTIMRLHGEQYTFIKHTPELRMTIDVRLTRILQRFALRRATILISPSQAHATEIARELGTLSSPIRVVPNGVRIDSSPLRNGEPANENLVLFAGRLDRVKGVTVFLKAAAEVTQRNRYARFIIAGQPHAQLPQSEIDAIIRKHSLEANVKVLGAVSPCELEALYRRASVVVVPSHYESFGLVALEAMANGVPVVATRTGGLGEIVEDGATGVLVAAGDASETAEAIVRLLSDANARKQMGEAAHARAQALFTIDTIKALNLSAYRDVQADWQTARQMRTTSAVIARGNAA
jgi:glycosyltransferase involved in cell wall biosynthesis